MINEKPDNIQMDLQAEQKLFSNAIEPQVQKPMPQTAFQQMPELTAATPYSMAEIISPQQNSPEYENIPEVLNLPQAEVAKINLGIEVKYDHEKETKGIKDSLKNLQNEIDQLKGDRHNRWIPNPGQKNNYEEKPSLEQTNLVFEARRERFLSYPRWG